MSRPAARPTVLAEVLAMCARCESRPGEMCVTITGKPAYVPHSCRSALGFAEWLRGFHDGAQDALDLVERYIGRHLRNTEDGEGRGDLASAVQTSLALAKRQYAR